MSAHDTIRLRGGDLAGMPLLADREPAYVRDRKALYIGTPEGNVLLASAALEERTAALEQSLAALQAEKLTASAAEAVPPLPQNADTAAVAAACNALLSALKAAGIMRP